MKSKEPMSDEEIIEKIFKNYDTDEPNDFAKRVLKRTIKFARQSERQRIEKIIDKFKFYNRITIQDPNYETGDKMDKRLKKELKQKLQ